ncbi:MAG TPA: hypothetical protein VHF24_08560 [Acidimicrobiales bacterium]|nr:hypothetical protein [Acidimicrobiales bacterium]
MLYRILADAVVVVHLGFIMPIAGGALPRDGAPRFGGALTRSRITGEEDAVLHAGPRH